MNMLKNKKGFTLIEMLVVIAIIAVLVAIIIPTVTSATTKASAATNAANLRSYKASITTSYLSGEFTVDEHGAFTLPANITATAPTAAKCDTITKGTTVTVTYDSSAEEFVVTYGGYDIDDFAKVAEDGTALAKVGKHTS